MFDKLSPSGDEKGLLRPSKPQLVREPGPSALGLQKTLEAHLLEDEFWDPNAWVQIGQRPSPAMGSCLHAFTPTSTE